MRLEVSHNFVLSLALIFLTNSLGYALLFLAAAGVHEAGHIVLLKIYKIKKPTLSLGLLGARIDADMTRLTYAREGAVYLGGALFNFLFCAISLAAVRGIGGEYTVFFFFANLFYALLNLMPIDTLDGGRALECALLGLCDDPFLAVGICRAVSVVFSALLLATALIFLPYYSTNVTLLMLMLWLLFNAYPKSPPDGAPRIPPLRRRLKG